MFRRCVIWIAQIAASCHRIADRLCARAALRAARDMLSPSSCGFFLVRFPTRACPMGQMRGRMALRWNRLGRTWWSLSVSRTRCVRGSCAHRRGSRFAVPSIRSGSAASPVVECPTVRCAACAKAVHRCGLTRATCACLSARCRCDRGHAACLPRPRAPPSSPRSRRPGRTWTPCTSA